MVYSEGVSVSIALPREVAMNKPTRSAMTAPAWGLILLGSCAFFYTAYAGMLGT
jgi:hypothetical protein